MEDNDPETTNEPEAEDDPLTLSDLVALAIAEAAGILIQKHPGNPAESADSAPARRTEEEILRILRDL